jgi:hypothetical protein
VPDSIVKKNIYARQMKINARELLNVAQKQSAAAAFALVSS